ncbi:precorrin-6y C5,15-methyltransferase (decarboxylating) subunit CbiE [Ruminococcus sp. CLA-AA-H200]|uniref:Precorrin-6y C5,15-methyltransferase (Decarboxylating) subunit CbiE n=1 Tax=Ruminococcus turbiniformis TaxID=2881258 RepID=A0ABS8FWN2_9FIRM|nr:precorrin-6y C5,15-methyltransferase (decarboxylating) subunit CbiE [Ruminococcus turbiniformis]MCC2254463.1 precorrin-6y C5,15-methyltransferase (decarboxylating) subunit CbiE [Ruminococcus turbiniformis]
MCENRQKIFLVGTGMGTEETMTGQAAAAICGADCLIGAGRMLETVRKMESVEGRPVFAEYRSREILSYIRSHPEYEKIAVLFSGDTGFYSGAKELAELLQKEMPECGVQMVPGIASVIYLAARLGTSWEDAALVSLHGKEEYFIQTVSRNRKTFLLLGGRDTGKRVLARLKEYGMDEVVLHVGTRLSYPDERIHSGRAEEFGDTDLDGLSVVLAENPFPNLSACCHMPDEEFIRGNVPMTKEEVRAVSIAALGLTENAVVYDIGAGTGSVSVEAARSGDGIRVYAVEKNPEAVSLICENRKKFCTDGICVVRGEAPEALEGLEAPTHVFIGGSSGNLKVILQTILERSPEARIVINAISLETVREVIEAAEEGLLRDARITQITASRARRLGGYHLMTGQNPVYIISAGGRRRV